MAEPHIPTEQMGVLFEPFVRGSRASHEERSVGLGLYIVKEIVSAQGGEVTVTSNVDAGTTFTLELPQQVP